MRYLGDWVSMTELDDVARTMTELDDVARTMTELDDVASAPGRAGSVD